MTSHTEDAGAVFTSRSKVGTMYLHVQKTLMRPASSEHVNIYTLTGVNTECNTAHLCISIP